MKSFIKEALIVKHSYHPTLHEKYVCEMPILTVIIDAYYNKNYLMQAVDSVLNQTYQNTELILVDNGSIEDVTPYLHDVYQSSINVAMIKYENNQFCFENIGKTIDICWNCALHYAKGNYILHLDYDDYISDNYIKNLVNLFRDNEKCTTATGLMITINDKNEIIQTLEKNNQRGRFTSGLELAVAKTNKGNRMIALYGTPFAIKKSILLKNGGFDSMVDFTQIFKHGIMGDSGYDPNCIYYRRFGELQLQYQIKRSGELVYGTLIKDYHDTDLFSFWEKNIGKQYANKFQRYLFNSLEGGVITSLAINLEEFRVKNQIKIILNIYKQCPHLLSKALWQVIKFYVFLPKYLAGKMLKQEHKECIKNFLYK